MSFKELEKINKEQGFAIYKNYLNKSSKCGMTMEVDGVSINFRGFSLMDEDGNKIPEPSDYILRLAYENFFVANARQGRA